MLLFCSRHIAVCLILIISPSITWAQMDMGIFAPPGEPKTSFRSSAIGYGVAGSGDEDKSVELSQAGAMLSVPFGIKETSSWSASVAYHAIQISTEAVLPSNQRKIPSTLSNTNFTLNHTQKTEGKKFWGFNVSYGSASDQPFANPSVNTIGANWIQALSIEEESSWSLIVNYSNNRPILNNIPLPGFAYTYTPSKTFQGTFGFPFVFTRWNFHPDLTWTGMILGFSIFKTELAYSIKGPIQLYTSFDFSQQPFLLRDREDAKNRFFYDEKKVALGIRSPLNKVLFADLSGGFTYDRNFFEAKDYDNRNGNLLNVKNTAYGMFTLSGRF